VASGVQEQVSGYRAYDQGPGDLKNIESLDKEKIGVLIDATPDAVIAKRFKKYLDAEQPETQKSSLPEQVNKFWNKILDKFGRPAPNRKAG
jgi:hypothetical protein